nr:MAG TPA: hypothetical protein [Caudoviricetes sp.]
MTILPTQVVCSTGNINLKVINSLNDIQIGVVNWLYKWRNR